VSETDRCGLCKDTPTTAVRGSVAKEYLKFCSFHAGAVEMILKTLDVDMSVKWKPLKVDRL